MKLLGSERSIEQTKDLNYNPIVFHKLILNNNNIIATGSQPKKKHTHIQDLDFLRAKRPQRRRARRNGCFRRLTFDMLRDKITIITTESQLKKRTRP